MSGPAAPPPDQRFFPEAMTPAWRRRLKATETGRVLAAVYRRRRLVRQLLLAPEGPCRRRVAAPPAERRRVRAVVWMPAGPGEGAALLDTWASAVASSPQEVALVVTDDWTRDAHAALITARVPGAVVVKPRLPTGGPPRLWPAVALALGTALAHFDFDLFIKLDADALVVGPGWIDGIAAAIAAAEAGDPERPVGIAGAFRRRPDGARERDEPYHRGVLIGELPRDPDVAVWYRRAHDAGWPEGAIVQGGCLVLTRACCEAIAAAGALRWRPRLRSIVSEDLLLTVLAYATGFRAASLGGPEGPLAIATKHLPLPLDELLDPASRWLVTHSVKVGLDGEPQRELRERARLARAGWGGAA